MVASASGCGPNWVWRQFFHPASLHNFKGVWQDQSGALGALFAAWSRI